MVVEWAEKSLPACLLRELVLSPDTYIGATYMMVTARMEECQQWSQCLNGEMVKC
jgi:hypothetical protein